MAFDFNPITGQLDLVGGGSSYIDGVVADSSLLPVTLGTPALDAVYLAKAGSGVWLINRKPAGLYCRTANNGVAADWTYLGAFPEVNSSTNWELYDGTDPTKELKFDLSGISTGTVRTITMPDANVTLPDQGTSTGDSPTFAQVTINDTPNDVSTLTLANDNGPNKIEFVAQELTLRHTGTNDTPYINVTDGTDYALLGVRQGDMFLQGSNAVVRIEKTGGGLADIKVNKLVLEDATTAGDPTATFDADGNLTASRTYDLPDASGVIALTSQIPAVSKTYAVFRAYNDSMPPATAFATIDVRNNIGVADFDDATDESLFFMGIIPEGASLGSGLKIRLHWMATTATSGDVVWDVSLERMTTDLDSDSFDTIASGTAAANGTSGILTVTEITLTTIDSVTAGDGYRLKVTRDANNASDTMTGDAELVVCEVRSAA